MRDDVSSEARRTSRPSAGSFVFGPFAFDRAAGIVYRGEQETPLPPKAAGVLDALLARAAQLVSKDKLLQWVHPPQPVTVIRLIFNWFEELETLAAAAR